MDHYEFVNDNFGIKWKKEVPALTPYLLHSTLYLMSCLNLSVFFLKKKENNWCHFWIHIWYVLKGESSTEHLRNLLPTLH